MARFTLACAFHKTDRLLELILPQAIKALTYPTRHEFEVVLVADRSPEDVVARLLPRLDELGVDELRYRRSEKHAYGGAPSNNFHAHNFEMKNPYLISFTDDTFVWKTDPEFDVLDALVRIFEDHPRVVMTTKVDDHEEWDRPLLDLGPQLEPGLRSVNRAVDQLIAYSTWRVEPTLRRFGGFEQDVFTSQHGFEYQWENLVSHAGTTGGRAIAFPDGWPLRVRHCDLRLDPGSMHGTGDEEIKLKCFDRLVATEGRDKE